ncbi:MAG: threonine/serine exporter family protein [Phycisphaerales bacterium]
MDAAAKMSAMGGGGGRGVHTPEVTLLTELAAGLAVYGAPAHRLEEAVSALARRLGVKASFFATPTAVFAVYEVEGESETRLVEVNSSDVNLERLVLLDKVLNDVWDDKLSVAEGIARIREVVGARDKYGAVIPVLAFMLLSGSAAQFFGGGWPEIATASVVGMIVGVLCDLSRRSRAYARVLEFVAGVIAVLVAMLAGRVWGTMSVETVTLAGVIYLIPGLTLTTAVTELSTRNLVSGTARLIGALTVLVSIGFGVVVGQRVGQMLGLGMGERGGALGEWTVWASLAVTAPSLVVLFRARWVDVWIIAVSSVVAFFAARVGVRELGSEVGVCVAAFAVGMLANGYARTLNRPSVVASVPGILLLVPGAIGFQSFSAFTSHDAVEGVQLAFEMILVAVSLVAGLLLANVALPPRKAL